MILAFIFFAIVFVVFGLHGVYMVANTIAHPLHVVIEIGLFLLLLHVARKFFDEYWAYHEERERRGPNSPR